MSHCTAVSEQEQQAMSASNLATRKFVMKMLSMNSNTILQGYKITLNWEKKTLANIHHHFLKPFHCALTENVTLN